MAPPSENPQIDIELSLLSGQDSDAAKKLATELGGVAKSFKDIQNQFTRSEQSLKEITNRLISLGEKAESTAKAWQQAGDKIPPPAQTGPSNQRVLAEHQRSSMPLPSPSSEPPPEPIPQFKEGGESRSDQPGQVGDKPGTLKKIANFVTGRSASRDAANSGIPVPVGQGTSTDRTTPDEDQAKPGKLARFQRSWLGREFNTALASGVGFSASDLIRHPFQTGQALTGVGGNEIAGSLGYQRGGFVGVGGDNGVGVQMPFSSLFGDFPAAQETRKELKTFGELALRPGIGPGRAKNIVEQTRASGFSGDLGQGVETQVMGPLAQQFGLAPSVVADFLGQLRSGSVTYKDLRSQLADLADSAKGASLNVNQAGQDVAGLMVSLRQIGASDTTGRQLGTAFMRGTGLPPTELQSLLSNPITQGIGTGATGLPPQALGAAGPAALGQVSMDTVNMVMKQFSGLKGGRGTTITDPSTGKPLYTTKTSAHQAQLAAAATTLGFQTPQDLQQFMNREERFQLSNIIQDPQSKGKLGFSNLSSMYRQSGLTADDLSKGTAGKYKHLSDLKGLSADDQRNAIKKAMSAADQRENAQNAQKVDVQIGFQPGAARTLLKVTQQNNNSDNVRAGNATAAQQANSNPGTKALH